MSEPDAMVFVVDDDAQTRDALKNLMRSVGLHVKSSRQRRTFCGASARMCPPAWCST